MIDNEQEKRKWLVGWVLWISTFVGYLTLNPLLCK